MPARTSQKDDIYWRILNSAVALDMRHGHQKWTMTQLSKQSKVSRTLIYYYFGKSKLGILNEAVTLFGAEFAGETAERLALWKEGRMAETFLKSRELLKMVPALVPFYFINRSQPSELGEAIRKKEKAFRQKLAAFFPGRGASEIEALFGIFWGLVFAPDLSEAGIRRCVELLTASGSNRQS
ncbi:MAG TPA: TetR/AcrR family transcriptional regulator [Bdellovibrionales bacterium]|nr:TetR/AcrR family transcriptional regulator [Bdellovibrionales bacterium]